MTTGRKCVVCGGPVSRASERCRSCRWNEVRLTGRERFEARIDRSAGPDGCWPWIGMRKGRDSYGFWRGEYAHRIVLAGKLGRPIQGLTRHTCDNPPCVNPAHLLEGTDADNLRDAYERGRHLPGGGRRPWKNVPRQQVA